MALAGLSTMLELTAITISIIVDSQLFWDESSKFVLGVTPFGGLLLVGFEVCGGIDC